MLRGHLVFTAVMNRAAADDRAPPDAARDRVLLDLLTAVLLFADAAIVAGTGALPAVFALALGARHRPRVARAGAGDHRRRVRRGLMIAIEIREPGEPDVLVPVERPMPVPGGRTKC